MTTSTVSTGPARQFIRGTVVVNLGQYADQYGWIERLPSGCTLGRAWIVPGSGLGAIIDLGTARDITSSVLDTARWIVEHASTVEVRGENAECVNAVTVAMAFPGVAA